MSPVLLQVADLHVDGLGPLQLQVHAGERVFLSGPSGAGKSRLLRLLADLDPYAGTIALDGQAAPSWAAPEWRRRVALLSASSHWWRARAADHFAPSAELPLAALDLAPALLRQPINQLSSGEKQRLGLLRVLANRPRVLLLDEPTANLDPASTQRVERLILEYLQRHAAGVLWVCHEPPQIRRLATRHLVLERGQLCEGPLP